MTLATSLVLAMLGGAQLVRAQDRIPDPHQPRDYSAAYKRCMASGGARRGVTVDMQNCTQDEIARQDALLNETYRKTFESLEPEQRPWLQDAERRWIKARDALCDSEAADTGEGSYTAVAQANCFLRMTAQRISTLNRIEANGGY